MIARPRTTIAAVAALLLAGAAAAQPRPLAWPAPTREARPWTRWWWLGSAVDSANLGAALRELAAAGFGGVEVTAIYGVRGEDSASVPYLSDRWVALLAHAADEARRLGMGLDMPPGSGWRTGGPGVPAADANASLRVSADTVRGGASWQRAPGEQTRLVEAAVAVAPDGRVVEIARGVRASPAEPLRWTAPPGDGTWTGAGC